MMGLSIRMRLSAWYLAVLCLSLAVLGWVIFWGAQKKISNIIDNDLEARLKATHSFMEQQIPGVSGKELQDEFEEYSASQPGGELLQISAESGEWVFQSPSMQKYNIFPGPAGRHEGSASKETFQTIGLLRLISAKILLQGKGYNVQIATDLSEFNLFLQELKWLLLISTPLAIVLALAGGYWLSGRALLPVRRITERARSIGAEDLSLRLDLPQTADEIRALAETLNEMLGRIEASFRRITQFTADASHELRTPVSIIRTSAEVALRHKRDEQEYKQTLFDILEESKRTSSLLDDLLDLTRLDSAGWRVTRSPVDISESIEKAQAKAQRLAAEKKVALSLQITARNIFIDGNAEALTRMFLVLFDNAVKYTPSGGAVSAVFTVRGDKPVFEIRDSGIGIAAETIPHIFERFFQADPSHAEGGFGLGLAIAQAIAYAHQAEIKVESRYGEGSVFRILFSLTSRVEIEAPQIRA